MTMLHWRSERVSVVLPDEAAYAAAYASLPAWRRRKCDVLKSLADRRRSVAAWLLLKELLTAAGRDAAVLSVGENSFGKPAFVAAGELKFNLSHTDDRALAVIAGAEVGCDVERVAPVSDELKSAVLVAEEKARIAALTGADGEREFFRLWVRKESYVKALGRGMGIKLASFSALAEPPAAGWRWLDFDFADGCLGSICAREEDVKAIVRIRVICDTI